MQRLSGQRHPFQEYRPQLRPDSKAGGCSTDHSRSSWLIWPQRDAGVHAWWNQSCSGECLATGAGADRGLWRSTNASVRFLRWMRSMLWFSPFCVLHFPLDLSWVEHLLILAGFFALTNFRNHQLLGHGINAWSASSSSSFLEVNPR